MLEYVRMLRRRTGVLLLCALLGLIGAVVFTLPQTPIYQARTTIEIQNLNENFLNMRDVRPTANEGLPNLAEYDLMTAVSILQSESVLQRVIAKLDLTKKLLPERNKDHDSAWRTALHLRQRNRIPPSEDIIPFVAKNLKVHMQANTRLVEIQFDASDPLLAAEVANTLTAEFIQEDLESRWQSTQKTGEWLTGQMENVRIKLEKSEQQLQAYAAKAGLMFTSEKDNVADEKLRQLQQELSRAEAERVVRQSHYELASAASADSLPEVLDDPILKDYQVRLTDLRRQLAELSSNLTPVHPSVKKIQAQVTSMEGALEKERTNVMRRIQNEFTSAQRREKLLTTSYEAQAHVITEQSAQVAHYNILKREVDNNRQLYDSMLQHVREAGVASTLHASNIRVIDPARTPARPYKPSLLLNSISGVFSGGLFGILFVVLRERTDRTIQAPGEAPFYLNVPELGVIPSAAAERCRGFGYYRHATSSRTEKGQAEVFLGIRYRQRLKSPVELITWQRRPSVLAECFRSTAASILYARENGSRPRVIALTSANPEEGKTTVASNLALALAEIGWKILLIDGDLRKPRLHEIFKISNAWGLSDFLKGTKPPEGSETVVIATGYKDLYVLPAGSTAPSISSLLHSPRAAELLQRMRQEFEMVIIDTPPMLHLPDARVLGRLADGVILVVRSARTTRENAAGAGQRLTEDGTQLLGTVLNEWDPRKAAQRRYEYGQKLYQYGNRPE